MAVGSRTSSREAWRGWYARYGRRVIATRDWRSEEEFRSSGKRDLQFLVERFSLPLKGRVHEIGCGPGRLIMHMQETFDQVTANDVCDEALADCRLVAGSNVTLFLGGAETLGDLPSDAYDAVVSVATLQHVSDCDEMLDYIRQAARMLKPTGVGVLQLSSGNRYRGLHDSLIDAGRRLWFVSAYRTTSVPTGRHWRGCRPSDQTILDAARSGGADARLYHDRLRSWLRIGPA